MEITVSVNSDYETLEKELKKNGFKIMEEYQLNDVYMLDEKTDLSKLSNLDILQQCVLVREIVGIKKILLYKYKKYADNWDILEQWKVECPITDISKAIEFMNSIKYRSLFEIHDKCIVFANEENELVVQLVNDKYIFIEMESKCEHIDRVYNSIDEMKQNINKYDLPIDSTNYFVKKAEMILEEAKKIA